MLLDYGLPEGPLEKLVEAGVGTIEKLGTMTPEQLVELGVGEEGVRQIQESVNLYYSQFEDPQAAEVAEPVAVDAAPAGTVEQAETEGGAVETAPAEIVEEAATDDGVAGSVEVPGEEGLEPAGEEAAAGEQSGTIENAGSPHNQSEGAGSREHPEE